jgi:hypothetical protein
VDHPAPPKNRRGARDLEWLKAQINDIYDPRDHLTPRYVSQAGLKVANHGIGLLPPYLDNLPRIPPQKNV